MQESFQKRHKCTELQSGSRLGLLGIITQSQGPMNKWKMLGCKETVEDLRGGEGRVEERGEWGRAEVEGREEKGGRERVR